MWSRRTGPDATAGSTAAVEAPEVPVTVITDEGVASGVLVGNTIRVPNSWAPEVLAEGSWCGNALRFRTREEADQYGADLLRRWTVPTDHRSVESDDPPNRELVDGVMRTIGE